MATDKAITYLKNKAPKGEFLAYINKKEAVMLKKAGGSGELVNGIPSYRSAKGMASKSSSGGSKKSGGTKSGNSGNQGGGGGGQNTPYRSYRAPTKKTYTAKTIDNKPVTGNDYRDSKQKFINKVNKDNRVAAAQNNTRFTPYSGGSRMQKSPGGGLGNLLKLAIRGSFPGAGLLMGGLNKFGKMGKGIGEGITSLNDKIQNSDFGRSTSLMDYLDARKYGGVDARDRASSKNMREAKGIQKAMDLRYAPQEIGLVPQKKPTFSDPFRNTVGTTTQVNAPGNKSSYVPFSNYGKANAATLDGVPLNEAFAPTPVEQLRDKAYTGIKENVGEPFSNFLNNLMNADQIAALENQYGSKYGITNTAGGISSDARHMAAMNELSNSLSPMNNKVGNFIGDTGAFLAGGLNEIPALFRGLDSKNLGEIKEDIIANYKGSFGTPNQTTAEQIYGDVFEGSTPARTASVPTYGTAAAGEMSPTTTTTEDITVDGGLLNNGSFMENQINPRVIAAENNYYNQGKMPPEFLGDRLRMNMELGNARGFMGPGFAQGGLASMFTRRR